MNFYLIFLPLKLTSNKYFLSNIIFKMPEEIQNQTEQKNTVALIGMIFSIVWLVLLFTIIGTWFGFILLCVWFILWIVWLFYKPRGKARVAICIPLVVFITIGALLCYLRASVKAPAFEFKDWAATRFEEIDEENFDDDKFEIILQKEANDVVNSKTEQERKEAYESSTWSNAIEKVSYLFFDVLKQTLDNSLEKYYNNELPEIDNNIDNENNIIDVDVETTNNEEVDTTENEVVEEENVEVFSDSEKDDIEQIIDILE